MALIVLTMFLGLAGRAHAQGSCPTAANMDGGLYAAPTHCYYIDFANGSDSNSGTTESSPWKHAPGMQGCAGTCAGVTAAAGDGFIFKGGDTWDYTIWPWAVNGSGSASGADSYGGCTGSGCIYFGVDKSWYSGSQWARPVFSGGDWSNPGTNTTCFYQATPGDNTFVVLDHDRNIIVDDFEFTGMCSQDGNPNGSKAAYIECGNGSGGGNFTIENSYFHRAAWPLSAAPTYGDYWTAGWFANCSAHWTYNVVDGSDAGPTATYTTGHYPTDPVWTGEGIYSGIIYLDHSVFYHLSDATDIVPSTVADNYFFQSANKSAESNSGATNVHEHIQNDGVCPAGSTLYHYNNVVDTIAWGMGYGPQATGSTNPCTYYVFNNVYTNPYSDGNTGLRVFNFPLVSTFYVFNNTMECGEDGSQPGYSGPPDYLCDPWGGGGTYFLYNSHFITAASPVQCGTAGNCAAFTTTAGASSNVSFSTIPGNPTDIITQSQSVANTQGYSYQQTYQFSPVSTCTSTTCATVSSGANEMLLCNQMLDMNAQAACKQGTTYGVFYDQVNHTAVPSGIAVNNRPLTGAWDVGAYQFASGSVSAQPAAPTGLIAVVQ